MGEKGRSEANRENGGDGERDGGIEQRGSSGLKMMIHPDPSECCHVPPSR